LKKNNGCIKTGEGWAENKHGYNGPLQGADIANCTTVTRGRYSKLYNRYKGQI